MNRIFLSLCVAVLLTTAAKADDPLILTSGLKVGDTVVLRDVCVCGSRCSVHEGAYLLVAGGDEPEWLGLAPSELAGQRVRAELLMAERRILEASQAKPKTPGYVPESEMILLRGKIRVLRDEAVQAARIHSRPKTWTITVLTPGVLGLEVETEDGRTEMFIPADRVRGVIRQLPAKSRATGEPNVGSKES